MPWLRSSWPRSSVTSRGGPVPETSASNGRPPRRDLPELWVCHLGTIEYRDGLVLQERVRQTDRGGQVTYHGPGQLVGYPIVRVDDVVAYVRLLEQALVQALSEEGIRGRTRPEEGPDFTGVWVEDRKIASIGVHVARGVTTHGFAVNVENDLQPFGWVVPCGLEGVQMTSLIKETGRLAGQLKCFRRRAAFCVSEALGRRQRLVSLSRLEAAVSPPAATPV
ncbi:MAG: lipoyl(octanoyl) transferase LipB [Actinobacteria bacterium]|nr:MAG: lipoyl(octanoyl) transferase LipB [Actinomycetota bacterium]